VLHDDDRVNSVSETIHLKLASSTHIFKEILYYYNLLLSNNRLMLQGHCTKCDVRLHDY